MQIAHLLFIGIISATLFFYLHSKKNEYPVLSSMPCHAMRQPYFFNMLSVPSKASLLVFISSLVALVPPCQLATQRAISPSGTFYSQDPCAISLGLTQRPAPLMLLDIKLSYKYYFILSQGKKGSSGFPGLNGLPGIKVMLLGSENLGSGRWKSEELP